MNKEVYIRVDANDVIATGHVMRCLSIAEQLRKNNVNVTFVTADNNSSDIIRDRKFLVDILNSTWNDFDKEIDIMKEYLIKNQVKLLIVDSYYITANYLNVLSEYTKIIYIDDLKKFEYNVSTVICDNPFTCASDYIRMYKNIKCPELLIGGRYAPLRDEFSYHPYVVRDEVKKILITTGGTDAFNITGKLIFELKKDSKYKNIEIHVIVGRFNQHKKELVELQEKNPNIFLHENVNNISYWMRTCDIAVSAGGTTLYELCSCGIPTVCLSIADNQDETYMWERKEYMLYAGNACENIENCIENCVSNIEKYCTDFELRKKSSKRMQGLIDGLGAGRIAEYIRRMYTE